jgi:predicted AAA+ superfamily ATPase
MPEAVAVFRETNSLIEVSRVHAALLQSYLDDMHKYRGRMEIDGVDRLLAAVAGTVGTQVKYSRIEPDWRIEKTKRVLHLLEKTMLIHPVRATAATGLPLGATASGKILKYLFLDVGLLRHLLGAPADMLYREELLSILRGALAEQFIGQQLAAAGGCEHHRLYYWTRRKKSSTAEVDYVISREGAVVPIEVKSGAPGRLKSLSIFLREHPATPRGVVLSTRNVEIVPRHKLHYLPLYAKLKG